MTLNATSEEKIISKILLINGKSVMIDMDLAKLYGVKLYDLIQAVKRNKKRFPHDFMFQIGNNEYEVLRVQIKNSSWTNRHAPPYFFTEPGIGMLSSILNSERAIKVNIEIMKTFKLKEAKLLY